MKKAMLIETLNAMQKNRFAVAKMYRENGYEPGYEKMIREVCVLDEVIRMMECDSFARQIREIYMEEV